jgi:hypothetical protein
LASFCLWGCTITEEVPPGSGTGTGTGTGTGAGGSAASVSVSSSSGTGGMLPNVVTIPATEGSLQLGFGVSAEGAGSKAVGAIHIVDGAGTVVIDGKTLPAVVYERQPFAPWTLYQTLAVGPDRIDVVWLYCKDGVIDGVYYETTAGTPVTLVQSTGTCTESMTPTQPKVSFPEVVLPIPKLLTKYTVTGPKLSIPPGKPGTVQLATPMTVLAFNDVDCTQVCGSPGWRELHALLWDPAKERACFGIFYLLEPGQPVLLEYALTLPDLSDPAGVTKFDASYSVK